MVPLWHHICAIYNKWCHPEPLLLQGFQGRHVTCFIIDKPKAALGCADRSLDRGELDAKSVPLAGNFGSKGRSANKQAEPAHIARPELMPLRSPELAPADLVARPCRIGDIAMPIDTQELEGRIADTHPTRFPVAYGPEADAQEFRGILSAEAGVDTLITELHSLDQLDSRLFPKMPATLRFQGILYIMFGPDMWSHRRAASSAALSVTGGCFHRQELPRLA
jgi:hypothetical protein